MGWMLEEVCDNCPPLPIPREEGGGRREGEDYIEDAALHQSQVRPVP